MVTESILKRFEFECIKCSKDNIIGDYLYHDKNENTYNYYYNCSICNDRYRIWVGSYAIYLFILLISIQ